MRRETNNLLVAIGLIILVVCLRLLPHPANFAPVAAAAIFGGSILPRQLALWMPLAAMMISDLVIGLHNLILLTWGCYALIALASSLRLRKPTIVRTGTLTVSASLLFFIVTNFGVWLTSGMYTHTWNGLTRCFELALPFFRNTILSDLIYTGALFGIYHLAVKLDRKIANQKLLTN